MISLNHHFLKKTLQSFTPANTNEVLIIIKYPNKSCDLDPFPTLLLKSCIDQLIFPITTIINLSMQSGVVPRDFDYRPISNICFLSKYWKKWLLIAFMNIFTTIAYQMIYSLHINNSTIPKQLFSRYTTIYLITWTMAKSQHILYLISQLLSIQLII